ncbi:MAG: iron complex outerrane recepter protein, partial [Paraburkholderia sp.]|nr:iron complex outerrane recepter protein [Paraburkholderia sp.]
MDERGHRWQALANPSHKGRTEGVKMKRTVLNSAIRKLVWAEVALTAALGTTAAFAQTQPAIPGAAAAAPGAAAPSAASGATAAGPAAASGATAAAPAAASGAATASNVHKMQGFQVTGSLIRSSDKVGFNQVQTVTQKDIQNSG